MNDSEASSPALGSYRRFKASESNEVENPANEEIIATIPSGTVNDSQRALEAAKRAQPKWATLLAIERAKLLPKLADSILAQQDRLA
jgi:lactaldehyde dehydrogenase/glycolaldehyde dehydrogenase